MTKISTMRKHLAMVPVCALFYLVGTVTAQAATYYVATTGNDAQTCATAQTITTPKRTFASAINCLAPGDTLYIRAGTWTEQIDLQSPNKTGTAGNYITIAGYPGETVTIRWTDPDINSYGPIKARGNRGYLIFENIVLDGVNDTDHSGWAIRDGNHHFIVRNNEIKNFRHSGLYVEGNDITIQNNRIHDQISSTPNPPINLGRSYGIYFHDGNNGMIEGNDIYDNPGGGIQAFPGVITNLTIRNNKIHDNNSMTSSPWGGIVVSEGGGQSISGVKIYNNLVYNNGSAPAHGDSPGIAVSTGADGTKIWNNTVYGNAGWGISIQGGMSPPTNTAIQNNIVFANISGQIVDAGTGSILDNNLTTDPNFMNAATLNFNLRQSSPAIDAGATLSQVTTDIRNIRRPQGSAYDIGAHEAGVGSDALAPSPPLGLKVN